MEPDWFHQLEEPSELNIDKPPFETRMAVPNRGKQIELAKLVPGQNRPIDACPAAELRPCEISKQTICSFGQNLLDIALRISSFFLPPFS
jgi:hypothetical protein